MIAASAIMPATAPPKYNETLVDARLKSRRQ